MYRSDWIHFLCNIVNRGGAIYIGFLSSGIVLMTSSITLFIVRPDIVTLQIFIYFFVGGLSLIFISFLITIYAGRVNNLLIKIMKEHLDVPEIENIYFGRKNRIFEKIKGFIHHVFTIYWYLIIAIGFTFIISGLILNYIELEDSFIYFIITIGIGLISIGLAFYSVKISDDSNKKMKTIVNAMVLEALSVYEDRRLYLLRGRRKMIDKMLMKKIIKSDMKIFRNDFSFNIWKGKIDVERIEVMLEYLDVKYQIRLIQWSINLFNDIFEHTQQNKIKYYSPKGPVLRVFVLVRLNDEHKKHIKQIMSILQRLEEFRTNSELRETLISAYNKLK